MIIRELPISQVNPAPYNPRKDLQPGDAEYERLRKVIDRFDLVEPLVWNRRTGNLVGGHQRLKILAARGDTTVQAVVVDLPPEEEKALNIALNKVTGEWDFPKLADLLQELDSGAFDMELTGFSPEEMEHIANWTPGSEAAAGAGQESPQAGAPVSLADRFGIPPFSVLNARDGWWQNRKRVWLALGIRSEVGRGENLLEFSDSVRLDGATYKERARQRAAQKAEG